MQRTASYPSVSDQPRTLAIAGSLLLVSISYVLLLAAPVITRHFGSFAVGPSGLKALESWLPLACGAGLVLGGASALVFVLTQITREAQKRPYVSLAPVLAAFSACVLIGLRAELPLPGVSSEHVAVFALAVAVVGGSLVQTPRVSAQLLGMACTFLPPASLFGVMWIMSGSADPARAVWSLPASTRAFLGLLTVSSFAIGAVATLGRRAEALSAEPALTARMPVAVAPADLRSRAEPRASTLYTAYDLEQSFADDEAALKRRGLPAWLIAVTVAAALVLAFLAVKLYMERKAASAFLDRPASALESARPAAESPSAIVAPSLAAPAQQPAVDAPSVAQPDVSQRAVPSDPAPALAVPASALGKPSAEPSAVPAAMPAATPARAEPTLLPEQALYAPAKSAPAAHVTRSSKARARATRNAAKPAVSAKVETRASTREQHKVVSEARAEPKPAAQALSAKPAKKEDTVSVALKAARSISHEEAKPAARPSEAKPAPTRGDESLDDLMDNVLKPAKGSASKKNDDPIYGL